MPKYLRYFIKQQRKYIFTFSLVSLLFSITFVIGAYFLSKALGILPYTIKEGNLDKFMFFVILLIAAEVVKFVIGILHTVVYTKFRGYLNLFIRIFGVDNLIELDYSKLAKLGSGKLLQIVKNGIDSYSYLIYDGIDKLIEFGIRILFLILLLTYFSWVFLLIFAIGFVLIVFIQKFIYKKLTEVRERERKLNEEYTKQTAKIFMNFILLKIAHLKQKELEKLYQIGINRINNYVWLKFWFSAGARFMNVFLTVVFIGVLIYFAKLYFEGKVSFDIILLISLLFMFAQRTLGRIAMFVSELAEKRTYIERFDSLLSEKPKPKNWIKLPDFKNTDISFDKVWFKYEGQKLYLFEDFSLYIPYGQKLAIIGKTGSGKSTLFKMITRLVEPEKGDIYLLRQKQKYNLLDIDPVNIYTNVGYFYQEPLVFDGTVKENVTLGVKDVSDEVIKDILKKFKLDHLDPNTVIGERGVLLSGGERQRLALTRVFVFDYDILLLDEPTSNLDPETEKEILDLIFERYKDKTIAVISHNDYVLSKVERVIKMKKGEIVEDVKR